MYLHTDTHTDLHQMGGDGDGQWGRSDRMAGVVGGGAEGCGVEEQGQQGVGD